MPTPNATKTALIDGALDLSTDTIRVLLLDDSTAYTFDVDNHDFVSDITSAGTEMDDNLPGYERKTVAGQTTSTDDADDEAVFDGDDVTWQDIDAGTIQTVVVYQQVGGDDTTPGDDRVLTVLDDATVSDLPLPTNGSDVTVNWNAEGILNVV